jgi:hypothetical protein
MQSSNAELSFVFLLLVCEYFGQLLISLLAIASAAGARAACMMTRFCSAIAISIYARRHSNDERVPKALVEDVGWMGASVLTSRAFPGLVTCIGCLNYISS